MDLDELIADIRRVVLDAGEDNGFDLRQWLADALVTLPDYVLPGTVQDDGFEDCGF